MEGLDFIKEEPKLISFTPPVPVPSMNAPEGFYIIAYKLKKDPDGKNLFVVTDHKDIDRFIQSKLEFGLRTGDVKIVEKSNDYLEALSIANLMTVEENLHGGVKRTRWFDWLMARYTVKEIFSNDTILTKYPI